MTRSLALLALLATAARGEIPTTCLATGKGADKPSPSLGHCYLFNAESCCVAAHDQLVRDEYAALLPESCAREYSRLEAFFCAACDPSQPSFTNTTAKTVNVCQSFAKNLFDDDRSVFDNCGVFVAGEAVIPSLYADENGTLIFTDAEALFNFEDADGSFPFRPTFLKEYTIRVVPDDAAPCFSASAASATTVSVLVTVLIAMLVTLSP